MPLKAFFVDIEEEKSRFCSYLCSNVVLVQNPRCQLLEGKFQSISVNFLIFYLFIFFRWYVMFFLLIGIEAITVDRFCFSYQF